MNSSSVELNSVELWNDEYVKRIIFQGSQQCAKVLTDNKKPKLKTNVPPSRSIIIFSSRHTELQSTDFSGEKKRRKVGKGYEAGKHSDWTKFSDGAMYHCKGPCRKIIGNVKHLTLISSSLLKLSEDFCPSPYDHLFNCILQGKKS